MFQTNAKNRIELLPDPKEEDVNMVAERLGLQPVGWIFTDLVAEDLTKGTVKNFRGNVVCPLGALSVSRNEKKTVA